MSSSSEILKSGRFMPVRSSEKLNFSQKCSRLSQYLKENGSLGDLSLDMNRNLESNERSLHHENGPQPRNMKFRIVQLSRYQLGHIKHGGMYLLDNKELGTRWTSSSPESLHVHSPWRPQGDMEQIWELLGRLKYQLRHLYREANVIADFLASFTSSDWNIF
ncbi:unnamed protein product [Ilex paraguariensis]|uniref:RNase H type-1 domain-containing protein n=1 Tax=Ilex paraguariensis TaxID=185542 RepID=A0ABC8RX25_9AQUA